MVSYHVYFGFSMGLTRWMWVPKGTLATVINHIKSVENTLGFVSQPVGTEGKSRSWRSTSPKDGISDEVYCHTVEGHNLFIRWFYDLLAQCSDKPPARANAERLTKREAQKFWHGLQMLSVPPSRWTRDYYRNRMDHLYEVMRGNQSEGVTFDAEKLKPKQAAAVVRLFAEFLDKHDLRLDVPNGHDLLKSSYDGGYTWCDKCGPIDEYDLSEQANGGCRRKKCPIRDEFADSDDE